MNKFMYYFIHITLLSMSITWIVLGIILLFYLDGGNKESAVFQLLNYIFFSITFLLVAGLFLSFKTRTGKEYWKAYKKNEYTSQKNRKENQVIKELNKFDYSLLEEYYGKDTFIVRDKNLIRILKCINIVLTLLFVIWAIIDNEYGTLIKWGIYVATLCIIALVFLSTKVKIDKDGISLIKWRKKVKTFKWEKIKTIGISLNIFGYSSVFGFMYISTRTIKGEPVFDQYIEKAHLVLLKPDPKAIHCILKYWDGEIKNLDTQKSWLKYINNL